MSSKYVFIIDTDQYAGNFERDMCAYLTGVIGDCEVGEEYAELYKKEVPLLDEDGDSMFLNVIDQRADDHGCYRPTSIWKSKNKKEYNSVAIFFATKPPTNMIAVMKERAYKFAEAVRKRAKENDHSWDENFQLTILGFRLVKETTESIEEKI